MRFIPFQIKDYPFIEKDLSAITMDLAIARLGKNAIRLPDRIVFSANYAQGMKSVEVPLDEQGYRNANLSLAEKMCLRRILELLEQADKNDLKLVKTRYGSQFEVVRAIRSIDQNFGGKRFIDIARDIIDANMGSCLYPYMASDLAFSLYLAYNKNVNRDVDGFMFSFVEFMGEFVERGADLRALLHDIEEKSSAQLYVKFLLFGLANNRIARLVSSAIVDLYIHPYDYRTNHARAIPVDILASLPKDDLISLFQHISPRYDDTVSDLFAYFGEDCDPDYLYAYQRNQEYDARLLMDSPAFAKLDPGLLEEMKLREWMVFQHESINVIRRFEELTDIESQKRFLKIARETGWEDVANALDGEAFSMRSISYESFLALLPYINMDIAKNKTQAITMARNIVDFNYYRNNEALLKLNHPAFGPLIREALEKGKVDDFATAVILADRFHCPDAIGIKEWH